MGRRRHFSVLVQRQHPLFSFTSASMQDTACAPSGDDRGCSSSKITELEAVAPRENVGGSIQRYLWAFSAVISDFVCVPGRHRCGLRGLDQHSQISCQISSPLHIPFQELDQVALAFTSCLVA